MTWNAFELPGNRRVRSGIRRFAMPVAILAGIASCGSPSDPARGTSWKALAAERWYTCGLTTADEAFCWGGGGGFREPPNPLDSIIPNSAVPVRVPGGHVFAAITVGEGVMCGLTEQRDAYCWGGNQTGDVGDGSFVAKRGPSAVTGGHRWIMVSAGGSHVCGITIEHRAYCWGNQFRGKLGNGALHGARPVPVAVAGAMSFVAARASSGHSCALTADGAAYCWGVNDSGMLGDGNPPAPFLESAVPVRVVGDQRFSSLELGTSHACGIAENERAYCWGQNYVGQLGIGSTEPTSIPTPVAGDRRWRTLSLGASHSCGITTDEALYCWGGNERGQFGDGTVTDVNTTPLLIDETGAYPFVVAGGFHTCGLTAGGTAWCWGRGDYGQLGNGVLGNTATPTLVIAP